MQYLGLAVVVAFFGLIILWLALRMLLGGHWLLGWLRGTTGLLVLAGSGLVGLIAWDLCSYNALPQNEAVATLSFEADGQQRYQVRVEQGEQVRFVTLEGDLWQLDARILRWKGVATLIGLEPGYRLDKLSGRYLAVEQQYQARHSQAALAQSLLHVDFWRWLRECQCTSVLLEAQPQRVTYMPISDGAVYTIEMAPTGLLATPANPAAEEALKAW